MEAGEGSCLPGLTHLLRVKTKGVAVLEPLIRATDCSFPSLEASPPAPPPEKGHAPLALDPLPPILRDEAWLEPILSGGQRKHTSGQIRCRDSCLRKTEPIC